MSRPKPVVLCILDGWGHSARREANAPALADTPNFDRIMAECPTNFLTTHGPDVGLPTGQMGNSEVGHTNIGAGRVVAMDLGQIDLAIEDGSFASNAALQAYIAQLQASGGTAHLMGLVSDGGCTGISPIFWPPSTPSRRRVFPWRCMPSPMGAMWRRNRPMAI